MKAYRIQARCMGSYLDHTLEAEGDQDALNKFSEAVSSGKVKEQKISFYDPKKTCITFEEVDRDVTTATGVKETTVGIKMGQSSIGTGPSND